MESKLSGTSYLVNNLEKCRYVYDWNYHQVIRNYK